MGVPNNMRQFVISAAFVALFASSAAAQGVKLDIQDGRVNLDASSVPVRQILAEWARVGGTKIVGGDKITGGPLTLKLVNLPERQALDVILRSVAGYMAAPRSASAAPGASAYDRIVILPTSAAAATASTTGPGNRLQPNPGMMAGTDRRVPPRPPGFQPLRPVEPDADELSDQDDVADTGVAQQPPVFTFPQPQVPGNQVFMPVQQNMGQPGSQPAITLQPGANGQPMIYNFVPAPNTTTPPPATGGFGVVGAPTPGVIQQPAQPGTTPTQRPPGVR